MSALNTANMRANLGRLDLTYAELSKLTGVSEPAIGNAFRVGSCSLNTAIKIGRALGLSASEMLNWEEEKTEVEQPSPTVA